MASEFKPVVTGGLAKQIAVSIGEAILQGRLKVNERLPTEHELAAQFGVSRPTIREALKRLAAQSLVRSQRGPTGGTFVAKPSEADLQASVSMATTMFMSLGELTFADLVEVRGELERVCCRLASDRRSDAQLSALQSELAIQSDPKIDDVAFCSSDVRFHKVLIEATQNPLMRLVMVAIIESLHAVTNLVSYPARKRQRIHAQHQAIYQAVHDRDPDAADRAVANQMVYLAETYADAQELRKERHSTKQNRSASD